MRSTTGDNYYIRTFSKYPSIPSNSKLEAWKGARGNPMYKGDFYWSYHPPTNNDKISNNPPDTHSFQMFESALQTLQSIQFLLLTDQLGKSSTSIVMEESLGWKNAQLKAKIQPHSNQNNPKFRQQQEQQLHSENELEGDQVNIILDPISHCKQENDGREEEKRSDFCSFWKDEFSKENVFDLLFFQIYQRMYWERVLNC